MKPYVDSARAAVLFGLFIGLAIAVHPAFFLFAAAIPITAFTAKLMQAIHERTDHTRLAYRAR